MSSKNAYVWVSPRGFSNEGTVYVVPMKRLDSFCNELESEYGSNPTARVLRLNHREAKDRFNEYGNVTWKNVS